MTRNQTLSRTVLIVGLLIALTAAPRGIPALRAESRTLSEPMTLLVRMREGLSDEEARGRLEARGVHVDRRIPGIDAWVVEAPQESSARSTSAALARDPDVTWAEPNGRVYAVGVAPNDTFYEAQQWNLRRIGLPEAWMFTMGDPRPVAVIDTGVDFLHPDLTAKIWMNGDEVAGNGIDDDGNGYVDDLHGWDFVNTDAEPQDDHWHGTHVAGIAAAHTDNATGIAGVSWQSTIMPLKALDETGEGSWSPVLEAIIYAADNGVRVLNLSLGGSPDDPNLPLQAIEAAVSYARSRDCLIVAAVGNSEHQPAPVLYPAALPDVLAVAATTEDDTPWWYSNRGPAVDVSAPGVSIFSTTPNARYAEMSGTSMATPHVSGLAALLWAFQPSLTADEVMHIITSTARDIDPVGWDERTGWGRVDASAAIRSLRPYRVYLPVQRSHCSSGPQ